MLAALVVILAVLWYLGYVHIAGINIPNVIVFSINDHAVTLWNLLILIVVASAISILPGPLRIAGGILLVLWILSVIGVLTLSGMALSNILIIAIIVGLVVSLFSAAY